MPDDADKHCDICQRAKFARPPIPSQSQSARSSRPGFKWHTDVIGPFKPDRDGFRYVVNFVDDATGYTWARAMKLKSDTASAFKDFLGWLDCEHKQDPLHIDMISILQSDRGGEYTSGVEATLRKHSLFDSVCKERNIKRCFTSAYTPSENGRAERANRTLCDTMRCNLIDARLGWDFGCMRTCLALFPVTASLDPVVHCLTLRNFTTNSLIGLDLYLLVRMLTLPCLTPSKT